MWFFCGDTGHVPKADILHNAQTLWELYEAHKKTVPEAFGAGQSAEAGDVHLLVLKAPLLETQKWLRSQKIKFYEQNPTTIKRDCYYGIEKLPAPTAPAAQPPVEPPSEFLLEETGRTPEAVMKAVLKAMVEKSKWMAMDAPELEALATKYGHQRVDAAMAELLRQKLVEERRSTGIHIFRATVSPPLDEYNKEYETLERDLLLWREEHPEWVKSVTEMVKDLRIKRGIIEDQLKKKEIDTEHYGVLLRDVIVWARQGLNGMKKQDTAAKTPAPEGFEAQPEIKKLMDRLKAALDRAVRGGAIAASDVENTLNSYEESINLLGSQVRAGETSLEDAIEEMKNAVDQEEADLNEELGGAEREEAQQPPAVPIEEENEPETATEPDQEVNPEDVITFVNKEIPLVTVMDAFTSRGYSRMDLVEAVNHLVQDGFILRFDREGVIYLAPIGTPGATVEVQRQPVIPTPPPAPPAPRPLTADQRDQVRKVAATLQEEQLEDVVRTGLVAGAVLAEEALGLFREELEARKALGVAPEERDRFIRYASSQPDTFLLSELRSETLKEWERKALQEIIDKRSAAHGRDWGEVTAVIRQTSSTKILDDIIRAVRKGVWNLTQRDIAELKKLVINRKNEMMGKMVKLEAGRPEAAAQTEAQIRREHPEEMEAPAKIETTQTVCRECGANFINLDAETIEVLRTLLPYSQDYYYYCPTCKKELAGVEDLDLAISGYIPVYIRQRRHLPEEGGPGVPPDSLRGLRRGEDDRPVHRNSRVRRPARSACSCTGAGPERSSRAASWPHKSGTGRDRNTVRGNRRQEHHAGSVPGNDDMADPRPSHCPPRLQALRRLERRPGDRSGREGDLDPARENHHPERQTRRDGERGHHGPEHHGPPVP